MGGDLPEPIVDDAGAWREWLDDHHDSLTGVWLVLAKQNTTVPTSLTYDQALEEALCYGWIDGQVQRRDEAAASRSSWPCSPAVRPSIPRSAASAAERSRSRWTRSARRLCGV
jgi:hypothetical protein